MKYSHFRLHALLLPLSGLFDVNTQYNDIPINDFKNQ